MLFVVGGGGGGCVDGCGCVAKLIQCFRDRVYIKISRELLSGLFNPCPVRWALGGLNDSSTVHSSLLFPSEDER